MKSPVGAGLRARRLWYSPRLLHACAANRQDAGATKNEPGPDGDFRVTLCPRAAEGDLGVGGCAPADHTFSPQPAEGTVPQLGLDYADFRLILMAIAFAINSFRLEVS